MVFLKEHATTLILLIFLSIVFLQSGVDKLKDWKGNLGWLQSHFSKTLFKNLVAPLLGILLLLELASGLLALAGLVHVALHQNTTIAFYAALLSCITLLFLLLGQRIAKDYEGAKTIVVYLVPAAFLLFILQ